nr:MAG TPA: hypothetical protein [Caudoviricetes sp.]
MFIRDFVKQQNRSRYTYLLTDLHIQLLPLFL